MHRKLIDRDPRFPQLGDKLAVRDYVASRVGDQHLAEVFTCGNSWDELDVDALPGDFVLKTTRANVRIVRSFRAEIEASLAQWSANALASRHGENQGEWWYAVRPNRLFAEELLQNEDGSAPDEHKLFVFHGRTQLVMSNTDVQAQRRITLRDSTWQPIPGQYLELRGRSYPNFEDPSSIPRKAQRMNELAERIARDLTFARVDLYDVDGRIICGEITLCPTSGYLRIGERGYDALLGSLWSNPEIEWNRFGTT